MKRAVTIIYIMCAIVMAASSANGTEELWKEAADAYAAKDFETAVDDYKKLVEQGESASLYYNYGNALLKAGYIGKAILYYERALRLDPSNEDIKYNLEFANLTKTDKIDRIEKFFAVRWYESITQWFTSNTWAYTSVICFLLAMGLFLLYRFGKRLDIRKIAFGLCLFALVISFISMGHAFKAKRMAVKNPAAILMVGSETAKSSPDESGTEVYVIHEGTKVFIKSQLGDWSEVQLEDGNVGWVRTSTIEVI